MRVEATSRQADGKILVAGAYNPWGSLITVGRLNADGTRDTTFNWSGWNQFSDPEGHVLKVTAIAAMPGGSVTVAALANNRAALIRFDATGALDPSFGSATPGMVVDDEVGLQVNALIPDAGGNLLALGSVTDASTGYVRNAAIARYLANGAHDLSFGPGFAGAKVFAFNQQGLSSEIRAAAANAGYVVAAGYVGNDWMRGAMVVRFLANGDVDASFAGLGWTGYSPYYNEAFGVGTDAYGNIVAVGRQLDNYGMYPPAASSFQAWIFAPDGTPQGSITRAFTIPGTSSPVDATAMSVAVLPNGNLLLGGTAVEVYTGRAYFAFARVDGAAGEAFVGPMASNEDDLLVAAYPTGTTQFVAVGTRETWSGDFLRRARYFHDVGLEYDTDFPQEGYDSTPNEITIAPVTAASPSTEQTSAPIRVTGIDVQVPIGIAGGTYSIGCTEPYMSYYGAVENGQWVCVRVTSSETPGTTVNATLTVGSVQAVFSVTTVGPPETTITQSPPNPSGSFALFYYQASASSGPILDIECKIDDQPWYSCPGNHTHDSLLPGSHTFQVRGINSYGADPTPATYTWTIVATPDTTISSAPPQSFNQNSATFTFSSPDTSATFECKLDTGTFAACASPRTYTALANGSHNFQVRGVNVAGPGWAASHTWSIDTVAPNTFFINGPPALTGNATATFLYRSDDGGVFFECSLDNGAWYSCDSQGATVTVADGAHTFSVRSSDLAGNVDPTPATRNWTVDLTSPETTITSAPSGTVTVRTLMFSLASSEPGSTFECSLDGAAFYSCAATTIVYFLPDGPHELRVRAKDSFGNTDASPAVASWTVDLPPPDTFITSGPIGGGGSQNPYYFYFNSDDSIATFECSLDGSAFQACQSPVGYIVLAQGLHTVRVRALTATEVDATPAERSWTIDTVAPDTSIVSGPPSLSPTASATFVFESNEPGVFQCALDGAAWAACASPLTYNNLAAGTHYWSVRAIDAAGNPDASAATLSWTIDLTAPNATITSGPSGSVPQANATFTFSADDGAATLECRLDGGAYSTCTSPATYSGLAEGSHTLEVRARDAAGNIDASPASLTWIVDTVAPIATITSGPPMLPASSNTSSATFAFAANESGVTFTCIVNLAPPVSCASPVTYTNLPEGYNAFVVWVTDAAGNINTSANQTWHIDLTAPDTSIASGPSGTVAQRSASFTFTSSDSSEPNTFECSLDGAAFTACSSPASYDALPDGAHAFQVRARDSGGNVDSSPASASWSVDTSAPDTSIASGPSGTVAQDSAAFTFSATDPAATFECSLDGAAFAGCASPVTQAGLADGMHMFEVRAKDGAGNVDASPASRTWSIDRTAPNTVISSGPSAVTPQTSATFEFSATEAGSTYQCKLDSGPYGACTSPVNYAALAAGSHSFSVYATDALGNADASAATWSWVIDLIPDTTITSSPPVASNSTSASFNFTSTESGTFECKLDAGAWTACASPKSYAGLSQASHTFQVRAKDTNLNYDPTPASYTWTVDTTAPNTTITGGPSGTNNPNTATFTFTSTESPALFDCKLDAGAFAACSSPKAYSGLARGSHTFTVRARDAAGNVDATPATRSWSVK